MFIGGEGKIVEIDESKFGRRKYRRGHRVEGQWVFGGIERDSGNSFLVPFESRDQKTLVPIIQKYIRPKSIIISDCWKAYARLNKFNYTHLTVNHSKNFKDPETGACTNKVEGLWRNAKHRTPQYLRTKKCFTGYLAKFMFLSKIRRQGMEPVKEFCNQAGLLYKNIHFTFRDVSENKNKNDFETEESI